MNQVMEKIKELVAERNQHQYELSGMQEMINQKTSRIVFLEGGIQSLMETLTESERQELQDYYKDLSKNAQTNSNN